MSTGPRALARRQILVGALPLLALAGCGTDTSERYQGGDDTGYVSGDGVTVEIAPDERGEPIAFTAESYAGDAVDTTAMQGELLVINVWYAACPPCRKEAPDLQAIHEDYSADGVAFLGVNVRDQAGPAQSFEKTYGITYPSVPDPDAQVMYALRGQVAPNAVPSTLVLDREGRVAARISGAADPSVLRAMIDKVLAE